MTFQQGLSGLNAASKNLQVIGNNVANQNTVGFKASEASFSDVFASSRDGSGGNAIGIGTKLSTVKQSFTQGDITITNKPLDMAINGKGFFKVRNPLGEEIYSRNGQFSLDGQGFVVTSGGENLQGYAYDDVTDRYVDQLVSLRIPQRPIPPKGTSETTFEVNLDSRKTAPSVTFDPTELASYNDTTSLAIFDQLGGSHTLSLYMVKDAIPAGASASSWGVYATIDGIQLGGGPVGTLQFDANGLITTGTSSQITMPTNGLPIGTSSFDADIVLDFNNSTQYGSAFQVNNLNQDGYAAAVFSSFSINSEGEFTARYANGQSVPLAKVALFGFRNPEALKPIGSNGWLRSEAAGPEFSSGGGDTSLGTIQSGALEGSNLDLTGELVELITAQRVYQANAQTIKTQDSILQTIVNLR